MKCENCEQLENKIEDLVHLVETILADVEGIRHDGLNELSDLLEDL